LSPHCPVEGGVAAGADRTTLARQLLLQRSPISALDAIEHLVGMQAQARFAPYYGLWSRLDDFTGQELSGPAHLPQSRPDRADARHHPPRHGQRLSSAAGAGA
jgi:hypothetical protein